jgi:hypothetical protein
MIALDVSHEGGAGRRDVLGLAVLGQELPVAPGHEVGRKADFVDVVKPVGAEQSHDTFVVPIL